ncbi:hypothetical protein Tco_1579775 [Tanacetum coccineum]
MVMMVVSVGRQPGEGVDVVAVVAAGGRRWHVEARGRVDRIDPVMGISFGIGRKSPPKKFFSGGGGGRIIGEGEREFEVCVYVCGGNE